MRILLIEDDEGTAAFVLKGLKEGGHVADRARDGRDGLLMATSEAYDAIVADRMLPNLDGLGLIQALRASGIKTPIIILSALGKVEDKVRGLQAGADDYLAKPFAFAELMARLEALARRLATAVVATRLRVGDLDMDILARTVIRAGKPIELQPREFKLLEYLMRRAGQVVTRTMLPEGVWDYHFDPQTNVIDVHISRLRQKVDKGFATPLLHTVRGAGYCLRAAG
ncbi:MAG: response regulator [Alphaproteobacteria bacterium]|nr:response regulator [Alphaproteobacteria bacterium]